MDNKQRKINNYRIVHSIHIGGKEVVFGVDEKDTYPFLVCGCTYDNPLSAAFVNSSFCSDDYLEAMQSFTDRVQEQIRAVKAEHEQFQFDMTPFTKDDCIPDERDKNIVGKVVVIKAEVNRYEYRHSAYQLICSKIPYHVPEYTQTGRPGVQSRRSPRNAGAWIWNKSHGYYRGRRWQSLLRYIKKGDCRMTIQIDTEKLKEAVSLDQIVELIFSNAAEEQAPSDFDFLITNDYKIMEQIRKYTREVKNTDFDKEEIQTLDDMVEELATELTDTILCVNLDFFKQGMKFGARLLLELTA